MLYEILQDHLATLAVTENLKNDITCAVIRFDVLLAVMTSSYIRSVLSSMFDGVGFPVLVMSLQCISFQK